MKKRVPFASGGSNVSIHEISITKHNDKSSPTLFQACSSGKHFKQATITLSKGGKPYLTYTFQQVFVTSFQTEFEAAKLLNNLSRSFTSLTTKFA